jgi:hypothetical protein
MDNLRNPLWELTDIATADLFANRFMGWNGNYPSAGETAKGIIKYDVLTGKTCSVCLIGKVPLSVEGTVNKGDSITVGTNGKGKVAGDEDAVCAYALETGTDTTIGVLVAMSSSYGSATPRIIKTEEFDYTSTSPVEVLQIEAGSIITKVFIEITEAWNGTAASINIGNGTDTDGYLPTASITEATLGKYGLNDNSGGVLIWDSTNKARIYDFFSTAGVVKATISPGAGASTGKAIVYVECLILPS